MGVFETGRGVLLADLTPQTKLRCQVFQHHCLAFYNVLYKRLQEALQSKPYFSICIASKLACRGPASSHAQDGMTSVL